jgi:hypothetical protein
MLTKRDSHADVERWFTECDGSRREAWLCDVTGRSAEMILDELLRRASPTASRETVWLVRLNREIALGDVPNVALLAAEGRVDLDIVLTGISQAGIPLPDLGVRVWPGTLAIDWEPGAIRATEVLTGFLDMLADMSALVDCPATLRLVGAGSEPLPERDQERFRAALSSRAQKAADAGA